MLQEIGGRVSWSYTRNQIAFDRMGDDGHFDWAPDGKRIVAKMRRGRGQEVTVLIEFNLDGYLSYIESQP